MACCLDFDKPDMSLSIASSKESDKYEQDLIASKLIEPELAECIKKYSQNSFLSIELEG